MTRLRQRQSEDARKNIQKNDCVSFIGCMGNKNNGHLSSDRLKMDTTVKRLVQSSSSDKPFQYYTEGMWAHEWLNISHSRLVFVSLEEKENSIHVFDKKGDIVRSISLAKTTKLTIKVNKDIDHLR